MEPTGGIRTKLKHINICALVCNLAHVTCSLPEVWPYRCKQNNAFHEKLNDALKKFKGAVLMLGK